MSRELNVLLLCDYHLPGVTANALADHINSFQSHSRHNIFVVSLFGDLPDGLDLDVYDVLVIHYSLFVIHATYLSESAKERIEKYKGLKVQYIQDEYRDINRMQIEIDRLGIDLLFTCIPEGLWQFVYPNHILPNITLRSTLTGYVQERLASLPSKRIIERTTDVFYRGRQLPYYLGSVAIEKYKIGKEFIQRSEQTGLVTDIEVTEAGRLYGSEWISRLGGARCTLGVESAASVLDFTGGFQRRSEAYLRQFPDADFAAVESFAFPGVDNRFNTAQISPRCFEAAAMRTCMILFEGSYSGILKPWRHYIPLKKDFSNFDEVCACIRDPVRLQEISDCAYDEIALNPSYSFKHFVEQFDRGVTDVMAKRFLQLRGFDPAIVLDQFMRLPTRLRLEIGRIHGPLYCFIRHENLLLASDTFVQHCGSDLDPLSKARVFESAGAHEFSVVQYESIKGVSARDQSGVLRLALYLWRKLPLSFRASVRTRLKRLVEGG